MILLDGNTQRATENRSDAGTLETIAENRHLSQDALGNRAQLFWWDDYKNDHKNNTITRFVVIVNNQVSIVPFHSRLNSKPGRDFTVLYTCSKRGKQGSFKSCGLPGLVPDI